MASDQPKGNADTNLLWAVTILTLAAGVPSVSPIRAMKYVDDAISGDATAKGPADVAGGLIYGRRERQPATPASVASDLLEGK